MSDPRAAARDRLCVALDLPSLTEALALVERVEGEAGWFKVGLELFVAEGPRALAELRRRGARLFLDLKLHDIPETVARAAAAALATGAQLLTVHAEGGPEMLGRAVAAAPGCRVVAVTVLTSLAAAPALVRARARAALEAGCHGVVCSPAEVAALRAELPTGALLVVPGIRPAGAPAGDQRRVGSPREAIVAGADLLVVGRPIRDAPDPAAAARAVVDEIAAALAR